MRVLREFCLLTAGMGGLVGAARAESKNPADYPLRLHIYQRVQTLLLSRQSTEEVRGDGRANLYEGGEPRGLDFEFACDERLQVSSGYETFPARWKKPGAELVALQPEFGKPNNYTTCKLKVQLKDFAYHMRNGVLATEPQADYKGWMVRSQYDPEHGRNQPVALKKSDAAAEAQPGAVPSSEAQVSRPTPDTAEAQPVSPVQAQHSGTSSTVPHQ